jgi:hypothetical protein
VRGLQHLLKLERLPSLFLSLELQDLLMLNHLPGSFLVL